MDSEKFIQNFNTILSLFLFKKKKDISFSYQSKERCRYHFIFFFQISNFKISKFQNSNFNLKKKIPSTCVCVFFFPPFVISRAFSTSLGQLL